MVKIKSNKLIKNSFKGSCPTNDENPNQRQRQCNNFKSCIYHKTSVSRTPLEHIDIFETGVFELMSVNHSAMSGGLIGIKIYFGYLSQEGWSSGAMVLGKLPVPGHGAGQISSAGASY